MEEQYYFFGTNGDGFLRVDLLLRITVQSKITYTHFPEENDGVH